MATKDLDWDKIEAKSEKELWEGLQQDRDIELQDDITYTKEPVGSYSGQLCGNDYTIELQGQEAFIYTITTAGVVSECQFSGSLVNENGSSALVKNNHGEISQCTVDTTVSAELLGGSLVVSNFNMIRSCTSSSTVQGDRELGGIVAENIGIIQDSCFTGTVEGVNIGGIAYMNQQKISTSQFHGELIVTTDFSGKDYTGGIVGKNVSEINQCVSDGTIDGRYQVGGVVGCNIGEVRRSASTSCLTGVKYIGSIVGVSQRGYIDSCIAGGEIIDGDHVGGLAGTCTDTYIQDSYSKTSLKATGSAFIYTVNSNRGHTTIDNCFTTATIDANNKSVISNKERTDIKSLYWSSKTLPELQEDNEVGTQADSTTEELKTLLI